MRQWRWASGLSRRQRPWNSRRQKKFQAVASFGTREAHEVQVAKIVREIPAPIERDQVRFATKLEMRDAGQRRVVQDAVHLMLAQAEAAMGGGDDDVEDQGFADVVGDDAAIGDELVFTAVDYAEIDRRTSNDGMGFLERAIRRPPFSPV